MGHWHSQHRGCGVKSGMDDSWAEETAHCGEYRPVPKVRLELASQLWASYVASMWCLSVLICKMGAVVMPTT